MGCVGGGEGGARCGWCMMMEDGAFDAMPLWSACFGAAAGADGGSGVPPPASVRDSLYAWVQESRVGAAGTSASGVTVGVGTTREFAWGVQGEGTGGTGGTGGYCTRPSSRGSVRDTRDTGALASGRLASSRGPAADRGPPLSPVRGMVPGQRLGASRSSGTLPTPAAALAALPPAMQRDLRAVPSLAELFPGLGSLL
jgi:hypothetical protein